MGDVSQALQHLGGTVRTGMAGVQDANFRREQAAVQEEERKRNRALQDELMGLRRPGMQVKQQQASQELETMASEEEELDTPLTAAMVYADKDGKLSARATEQILWQRDPKEGEPESNRVLQKNMVEAIGPAVFKASYQKEGPLAGNWVRNDGTVVTKRDLFENQDQVETFILGRSAQGRMIRSVKENAERDLRNTGNKEAYAKAMQEITAYENNPALRISELQKKITMLEKVNTRESKAAIERAGKSIDKQFARMGKKEKDKVFTMSGGWLVNQVTGEVTWYGKGAGGEDELSPSQQIKKMELSRLALIFSETATQEERKQAALDLETIRGKDARSEAIRSVMANAFIWDKTQQQVVDLIDTAERRFRSSAADITAGITKPPPEYKTEEDVRKGYQAGNFGEPGSDEAKKKANEMIDAL